MYKYKSTCRFKMLLFIGSEIVEVRPQQTISSKEKLEFSYLKVVEEPKITVPKKKYTKNKKEIEQDGNSR